MERNAADAGANGSNFLKERNWQCEVQGKQQRISHNGKQQHSTLPIHNRGFCCALRSLTVLWTVGFTAMSTRLPSLNPLIHKIKRACTDQLVGMFFQGRHKVQFNSSASSILTVLKHQFYNITVIPKIISHVHKIMICQSYSKAQD